MLYILLCMGNEADQFYEDLLKRKLDTTDLLFTRTSQAFIRPDAKVLVVGPGIVHQSPLSLPMDFSLAVLPHYLKNGGGITVLEAPERSNDTTVKYGSHSIDKLQQWFKFLAAVNPICPVEIVTGQFPDRLPALAAKYDIVYDHLTADAFLSNQRGSDGKSILDRHW